MLLKKIEKVAREAFTSNMSVTLGGPAVPTPVDGLVISPHPYGYWAPYTASITAKATKANLAESFTCTFNVKGWPFYDEATSVTMHHVEGNIWRGTTVIQRREQDPMISYVDQADEPAWWASTETDGLVDKSPGITFGPNSCTGGKTYTVTEKLKAPPADPVLN